MLSGENDGKRLLASVSASSLLPPKTTEQSTVEIEPKDIERQPKLKLFESPLTHTRKTSDAKAELPVESALEITGPLGFSTALSEKSYKPNKYNDREDEWYRGKGLENSGLYDTPEFRRHEEATNIELFYDLFFVANLTTFTEASEITDSGSLKAYAGFFCILWFLWLQVSLFDVRFVTDSILERAFKAAQFGIMVGLAAVGPNFEPSAQEQRTFRSLAIILMLSRVLLAFQYGGILYHVWNYKNSKTPLAMVVGLNLVAALVYMGTFFGFEKDGAKSNIFILWYVTAVLETAINIGISARHTVLSFVDSHLVQRMSLLTLIILGEGVIGICKSIATIVENESSWSPGLIGTVIAAVAIMYFVYMIYFDWMNHDSFGAVRQELWAFLHFPFHLALVLMVEGAAQFIVWRKVVEVVRGINKDFSTALTKYTSEGTSSVDVSSIVANITEAIYNKFPPFYAQTLLETQKTIYKVGNATFNSTEQFDELRTLFSTIQDSIFDTFDISAPESKTAVIEDPNEQWTRHIEAFMLVYVYFFVASGVTLMLMNILNIVSKPKMTRGDYVRVGIFFSISIIMVSIAALVNTTLGFEFAQSAWLLPTVATVFVLVMGIGYIKLP